mgnify:CR=1 FL=1
MVLGRPADLIASLERCAVLQEMNEHDRLAREAGAARARTISRRVRGEVNAARAWLRLPLSAVAMSAANTAEQ